MPEIKLSKVCKYFIDKKTKVGVAALFDFSLVIPIHSFTVILGSSGSGKTTLLRTIAGLCQIDSGEMFFDDFDVTSLGANKRNVSFITQNFTLYPNMSIFENIAYPLKISNVPVEEIKERVAEISSIFGLNAYLSRKPKVLSGGQQQKVSLARALIKKPDIVLLDEPFSNLDIPSKEFLKTIFLEVHARYNTNFIMVTHNIEDAHKLADLIVKIENGEVIETIEVRK